MTTLAYFDGFESQQLSISAFNAGGTAVYNNITGAPVIETGSPISGTASLKIVQAGTTCFVTRTVPAGNRDGVVGFRLRFLTSLPSGDVTIFVFNGPTNAPHIAFHQSTGKLCLRVGTETGTDFGPSLVAGTTYWVTMKVDATGTTYSLTASVDGGSDQLHTRAGQTAADFASIVIGNAVSAVVTANWLIDDLVFSLDIADYPFAPMEVRLLKPTGDGSHNAGTNTMENQAAADIGAVTAFDLIDEVPPESTDYIQQSATGTTRYAEVTFANALEGTMLGVVMCCSLMGAAVGASDMSFKLVDSGATVLNTSGGVGAVSGTTVRHSAQFVTAAWTKTMIDGLVGQVGFANDVSPVPRALMFVLQYVFLNNVTVTPTTVAATTAVPTPTVTAGARPAMTTVAAVDAIPTPVIGISLTVTPTTVAAITSIATPAISLSQNVTPTTVAAITSILVPVVSIPTPTTHHVTVRIGI